MKVAGFQSGVSVSKAAFGMDYRDKRQLPPRMIRERAGIHFHKDLPPLPGAPRRRFDGRKFRARASIALLFAAVIGMLPANLVYGKPNPSSVATGKTTLMSHSPQPVPTTTAKMPIDAAFLNQRKKLLEERN